MSTEQEQVFEAKVSFDYSVQFHRDLNGRKRIRNQNEPESGPIEPGNIPRIARLLALAIRFEGLVRSGEAKDYADLACLGMVSRARITQIMNLLLLAPDIQEAILFLPRTIKGYDPITEHHLRLLTRTVDWREQRRMWGEILKDHAKENSFI